MWSPANYARGGAWVRLSQYVRRKTSKSVAQAPPTGSILSALLGDLTLTASSVLQVATPLVFGTLSATLDALTGSLAGQATRGGLLSGTLSALTGSGTGKLKLTASVSSTLGGLARSALSTLKIGGSLTGTLDGLTLSTTVISTPTLTLQSASGAAPIVLRLGLNSDHYEGQWIHLQLSEGADYSGALLDDYYDLITADDIARESKTLDGTFVQPTGFYRARVRIETNPDDATVNTVSAWSTPDVTDTVTATTTTLDPAQKNASLTLSNGNLTATGLNQGAPMLARTTAQLSAGDKAYLEIHYDSAASGGGMCFGVCNSSASMTNFSFPGSGNSNGGGFQQNGLYPGGIYYGVDEVAGDTYMLAVSRVDAAMAKFWVGRNGSWKAGEDPATDTGGLSVTISQCYGFAGVKRAEAVTVNFGASAFAYTPPTGFSQWP
jgi:hypothetical protein